MITSIHIENFKSIQSLDIELGRLNIFIGANGCGKSNILEAIAMGSAAMEDKLDDVYLVNKGVRVTEPGLMKSRFDKSSHKKPIWIKFSIDKSNFELSLSVSNKHNDTWAVGGSFKDIAAELNKKKIQIEKKSTDLEGIDLRIEKIKEELLQIDKNILGEKLGEIIKDFERVKFDRYEFDYYLSEASLKIKKSSELLDFLIYAPENHFLRRFEEEAAAKPLGIKGEGLFKLITIIAQEYPDQFAEIKKHLKLIDWFEDFEIPGDLKFTERRIKIKDQYLGDDLQYFDQRSANEGFLYLLFYLTLFISNETPHFFGIDNIDNSLNPKLGSELIKILAQLAKDHNKQAILTTHNPVILDGLDLDDPDQRLFVVFRNADGHTKVRRIPAQKSQNGIEPVRLSEAFIRGYIGGLPDNF